MRWLYVVIILLIHNYFWTQGSYPFLTLGTVWDNHVNKTCIDKVKVANERPSSCTYGDVWYPVIIENFNYTGELLNNYSYHYESTLDDRGLIWMGDAIQNGNFYTSNGELILEIKKQSVSAGGINYSYTGALLRSLYKTRLGYYQARIKFPNNIYMWPAFWNQYGSKANGDYEEIDWCEFFDNCPSKDNIGCGNGGRYNWMRMNIITNIDMCTRTNYINTPSNFFNFYHVFGGKWTDYNIEFILDNNQIAFANKYWLRLQ